MPDYNQLTSAEILWVGSLILLILRELIWARSSASSIQIFKPTVIIAVVLAYYALLGPFWALSTGEWFDRGIDRRPDMVLGWAGAAVFYAACLAGFYGIPTPRFNKRLLDHTDVNHLYQLGTKLCQVGLLLFSVVAGFSVFFLLNPFAAGQLLGGGGPNLFGGGGLSSYFLLALNFLIPGICLLFASWVITRRHLLQLLFWSFAAAGIFTTLGFRFRLVLLAVPLLIIWYMIRDRRPRLVVVAALMSALIFMAGYVGLTRSYGQGLDVAGVQGLGNDEIFQEGFSEAHVFLTTGAMMAVTPSINPFVGAQPILSVIQFPIPRAFFPEKDTFAYFETSIVNLFGSTTLGIGSAVLCYGEWFLMAGWPSLIAVSLAFGWLLRCLWNWVLFRIDEPLAIACYAVAVSYLYLVVSRGYMAQVVSGAVFTVLPLFWIYRRRSHPVQ